MQGFSGRSGSVVAGLVVAVMLVACGGGSGQKKAQSRNDVSAPGATARTGGGGVGQKACGLLTRAEVEAALGAAVQAPNGGDSGVCSFKTVGGQVLVLSTASPDNAKRFDSYRSGGGPVQRLDGLGDEAFVVKGQAYLLKGPVLVAITVLVSQPSAKLDQAARQLAQVAAARI